MYAAISLTLLLLSSSAFALPPEILKAARSPEEAELNAPLPPLPLPDSPLPVPQWSTLFGSPRVRFGVLIDTPVSQSPVVYSQNPLTPFRPAPNAKLFTTALALDHLGPDYRFETTLRWTQDPADPRGEITDLTLIGSGDPSMGLWDQSTGEFKELRELAAQLARAGVKTIYGPIRVSASDPRWEELRYPSGWTADEHTACYGALPQSFTLQLNCATFLVQSASTGSWKEEGVPMPVSVQLTPGSATQLRVQPVLDSQNVPCSFRITGTLARSATPTSIPIILPVVGATEWARNVFISALRREGILLRTQDRLSIPASRAQTRVLSHFSEPLSAMLKPFLKDSLNQIGDALFKKIGELQIRDSHIDLWEAGRESITQFLPKIGAAGAIFWDGSGISQNNSTTPMQVLHLLDYFRGHRDFSILWESLPIAGIDGTLKNRMQGTPAQGVLRAKTGTLSGVYNLSGYIPRFDSLGQIRDLVPFVILTQTTTTERMTARGAQDRAGSELSSWVNSQSAGF